MIKSHEAVHFLIQTLNIINKIVRVPKGVESCYFLNMLMIPFSNTLCGRL